jgi:hypothetical protein
MEVIMGIDKNNKRTIFYTRYLKNMKLRFINRSRKMKTMSGGFFKREYTTAKELEVFV